MLYDFDRVDTHNLANQQFRTDDISLYKVEAVYEMIRSINPHAKIQRRTEGWHPGLPLSGHVFMGVDSMVTRNQIYRAVEVAPAVNAIYDFRLGLADAQHYAADTSDLKQMEKLRRSLDFTDEEARQNIKVSTCNMALSIYPTVATITALGVANFINQVKGLPLKNMILIDAFDFTVDAI